MNSWSQVSIPPLSPDITLPQLSLFDSASKKVEDIEKKDLYRIYVCGITPYDATHLGHAATYLSFDLIQRYLLASGSKVRFVQNITDIDDPLLERANRDGVDWKELAQSQIDLFKSDMVALHILPPDHYIGVVEAMDLVIASIEKLVSKNSTYQVDQDLYFKVHADAQFGSRSHLSQEEMLSIFAERGGDPSRPGKLDPLDPLLWLRKREGEPSWSSSLGEGRPGWHIECCAIALHYLEPDVHDLTSVDIQGGGSDLIFPHHEMSAAQGAILEGRPFAQRYIHAGMVGLDGEKMSKSKGNLVFVSRLIQEGIDPMVIRWALLKKHYRADFMWTNEHLRQSQAEVDRLRVVLSRIDVAPYNHIINSINKALSDDLNTPLALDEIMKWVDDGNHDSGSESPGKFSRYLDSLLGLAL